MVPRSRQASCPSCSADITEGIPESCTAHLHPALIVAYASIKKQFAPRRAIPPKSVPYYLDPDSPVGERAILEKIEDDWWRDIGKLTYDACYPDRRSSDLPL